MPGLQLMDTTIRDGQQSLWATRMSLGDMLPILPKMDKVGYWAVEAWGGATFDTCLRFLDENPWERLRSIKAHMPNTDLAMLSRGQNLVGYKHYSKDIVNRFIACAKKDGIQVFRVFDALNDIRNVVDNAEAIKACGGWFEGAISYTVSPVHTLDGFLEYAQKLKDLGADSIAIKDMAGLLTPYRTERLVKAFNAEIGLPVHVHTHYVGGMAPMNIIKAAEAGAAICDTASAPLAFGNSHPAVETIVAALQESRYDTGYDLELLFEIAEYWEEVRKRGHYNRGVSSLTHMKVYSHQIPGGMMSNLMGQLEIQKATDRLDEVIREIPTRACRGRLPAARDAYEPNCWHAGRVQRAYRLALERCFQGNERLPVRLLRQGAGPHGSCDLSEGCRQFRSAVARCFARVAEHHDVRRARRGNRRFGEERRRRAHVCLVSERGAHVPLEAPRNRES